MNASPAKAQMDSTTSRHANTVGKILQRSVAKNCNTTALQFEDRAWTYGDLEVAVHRVAHRLLQAGLQPGARIGAYGLNSDAYVVLYLACAHAGFVHVPMNFALKNDELSYLLDDSGATLVIADPELLSLVQEVMQRGVAPHVQHVWPMLPDANHPEVSLLETALAAEAPAHSDEADVTGSDLLQLLYTSGTTSAPKGAMMTHSALIAEYISCIIALDFTVDDHPLVAMPLYHSAAMHVFLMPYLSLGATIRLLARLLEESGSIDEASVVDELILSPESE